MKHSIEEIKKMLEGITPGEWSISKRSIGDSELVGVGDINGEWLVSEKVLLEDAQFIAASPSIIRDLLAENERRWEENHAYVDRIIKLEEDNSKLQTLLEAGDSDLDRLRRECKGYKFHIADMRKRAEDAESLAASCQKELASAKVEAESLAMSLYRQYYRDEAPKWGLCDTVAGVITQIDNMVAGICRMLTTANNLAASRLVDQEAIERHTRRVTVEECARIAELKGQNQDCLGQHILYCYGKQVANGIADAIRAKFGASNG